MRYARYWKVAGYVFGGALGGVVTSLILLFSLIEFGVMGNTRGLMWPAVLIFWIVVFYAGGLLLGLLGGLMVALRADQQQPSHEADSHSLLKQLLADAGALPDESNSADGP